MKRRKTWIFQPPDNAVGVLEHENDFSSSDSHSQKENGADHINSEQRKNIKGIFPLSTEKQSSFFTVACTIHVEASSGFLHFYQIKAMSVILKYASVKGLGEALIT